MRKSIWKFFVVMLAFFGVITFGKTNVAATETPELSWEVVKYDVTTSKMMVRFSIDSAEGYLAYYRTTANNSNDGLTADEMFQQAEKVNSNTVDIEMVSDQYKSDNERLKRIYFFVTDENGETYKKTNVKNGTYSLDYFMSGYNNIANAGDIFLLYGDEIEWVYDDLTENQVEITFLDNAYFFHQDKDTSTSDSLIYSIYYGKEYLFTAKDGSEYATQDFSGRVDKAGDYTFVFWRTGDVNTKPQILTYTYVTPETKLAEVTDLKWCEDAIGQCSFKALESEDVQSYNVVFESTSDGGKNYYRMASKSFYKADIVAGGTLSCDFSSNMTNMTNPNYGYRVGVRALSDKVDSIAHSQYIYSETYFPAQTGDDGTGDAGNDESNTGDTPSTPPSGDTGSGDAGNDEGNTEEVPSTPPSDDTPSVDDGNNDSNTEETPSTPPSGDIGSGDVGNDEGNTEEVPSTPPSDDTPSVDDGNNDSNTEEIPSTPPSDDTGSGDAENDEGNTEDIPSTPPSDDTGSGEDDNNGSYTEDTPSNPSIGDTGSGDVPSTDSGNNDSNVNDTPSNDTSNNDAPSVDVPSGDTENNDNSTNNTPNTDTTAPAPLAPTQRVEQQVVLPNGEMGNKISTNGNSQVSVQGKIASGSEFLCVVMNQGEEYNRAANAVTARFGNTSFAAFDLNLTDAAGNKITTFEGTVEVQMPIPEGLVIPEGHTINVYYLAEDGTLSKCDTTVQNGMVTFTTNHFSTYVYVVEPVQAAAEPQPEAPKAEENNTPAPEVVAPKTGDGMFIEWAVVLMLVLAAGSVVLKKVNRI